MQHWSPHPKKDMEIRKHLEKNIKNKRMEMVREGVKWEN